MRTIRELSAEAVLLAGGARAILLQLADPAVAAGVARHSDFAERPLDRLHGTLTYLYVTVYGTDDERAAIAREVGAAQRPVRGDGYDARDESLQLWVAATLYDSARLVRDRVWHPLTAAEEDALLAEYAAVGTALGMPRALWPTDTAAFARYRDSRPLRVTPEAREVAQALLHSRAAPLWMRALLPLVRRTTAGMLSPELREAYGLAYDARRDERLWGVVRAVYPRLPRRLRTLPARRYLRAYRRRSA
jgi:uncharacterized protein (DUF2236 family)